MGEKFTLVGAVGSGGSMCGTIEKLRETNINIKLIGVDTFGSVLFGLEKNTRKLRGLGNSIMPKNLIHHYFDQIHWVNAECAYKSTRDLHARYGLFRGPTTGAAYQVAHWVADKYPDEEVVFISADSGYRYASTVYSDEWMIKNIIDLSNNYVNPICAQDLKDVQEPWSYFDWNRRDLL
jgi:cysteine synthase A